MTIFSLFIASSEAWTALNLEKIRLACARVKYRCQKIFILIFRRYVPRRHFWGKR